MSSPRGWPAAQALTAPSTPPHAPLGSGSPPGLQACREDAGRHSQCPWPSVVPRDPRPPFQHWLLWAMGGPWPPGLQGGCRPALPVPLALCRPPRPPSPFPTLAPLGDGGTDEAGCPCWQGCSQVWGGDGATATVHRGNHSGLLWGGFMLSSMLDVISFGPPGNDLSVGPSSPFYS